MRQAKHPSSHEDIKKKKRTSCLMVWSRQSRAPLYVPGGVHCTGAGEGRVRSLQAKRAGFSGPMSLTSRLDGIKTVSKGISQVAIRGANRTRASRMSNGEFSEACQMV